MLFLFIKTIFQTVFFFYNELKNSISETNNKMYEKVMTRFFKELVITIETKELNNQNIEKIISLITSLDMPLKTIQCQSLVQVVKDNNQLPVWKVHHSWWLKINSPILVKKKDTPFFKRTYLFVWSRNSATIKSY